MSSESESDPRTVIPATQFAPSTDQCKIAYYRWAASETGSSAVGTLFLIHGLGEHITRYSAFARYMNEAGIDVVGMDHRGHGNSDGPKGNIRSVQQVIRDMDAVLTHADVRGNVIVFGHSMGGCLALCYAFDEQERNQADDSQQSQWTVKGYAISAPWLRLSLQPPKIKVWAGKLIGRLFPGITLSNEIDVSKLSRDQHENEIYKNDPLNHDKIAGGTFLAISDVTNDMFTMEKYKKLQKPVIMLHGTADAICSQPASKEFFDSLVCEDKEYVVLDGAYHESFVELPETKTVFYEKIRTFVVSHLQTQ
eukprot:ANDGO_02297.mRNA.1 putative abhydrolase domain-containing protein DDB_G0269086